MEIGELKQLLSYSWQKETCSPGLRNEWNEDNPSLGQGAITSLIVNDIFGGKIMRCIASSGSHYYNLIDDEFVDLTVEQFLGEIPDYDNGEERTREHLLSNEDTKNRYLLLKKNLKKTIEEEKIIGQNRYQMCVKQRSKKTVLNVELSRIQNQNVRTSTEIILDMLPDYFYEIPASSSGKYHPSFSLGEGGLVRHVKVAMRILEEMFRDEAFGTYDDYKKDLIRMALILHDGFKSGVTYSGHTCSEHPVIMSEFILNNKDKLSISGEDAQFVSSLILTHMGPWNKDKAGNIIMPVPKTREELLVHLCDYIASRNFLNVYFENNEISDSVNREKALTLSKK